MSYEACCRDCDEELVVSNKGLWKALCLDCAKSKSRQSTQKLQDSISYWRDRANDLEQENESLKSLFHGSFSSVETNDDLVCCRTCNVEIEMSRAGLWKTFCLDCTSALKSELMSKTAQVSNLERRVEQLEYDLESKETELENLRHLEGKDESRRREITNLHNVNKARIAEISQLNEQVEDLRTAMEDKDSERRREITTLNTVIRLRTAEKEALRRMQDELEDDLDLKHTELMLKNTLLQQCRHDLDELRAEAERHKKLCPGQDNEVMLQASEYTDLCVSAGQEVFHVHRAILSSRSPVFARMLSAPMRESNERLVEICDMTSKGLEAFLHCLYTGRFPDSFNSNELGTEVMAAADKYDISWMQDVLEHVVPRESTSDLASAVERMSIF